MTRAPDAKNPRELESFDPSHFLADESQPRRDPLSEARKFAARSRRFTFWLAWTTILAWILACGAAIWTAEIYFNELSRQMPFWEYRYAQIHEQTEGTPWNQLGDEQQRELSARQRLVGRSNELMMILTQTTVVLFGTAALLSVWLTIASRRTALRQINANLISITLELQKLLPTPSR